jgi:hypothetical protein
MQNGALEKLVSSAKQIYESRLRAELEKSHMNDFVAIEPESQEFFLGKTLTEAASAARAKFPNRLTHVVRVGHRAALHFGAALS